MTAFAVRLQDDGWHVSDGRIDFGPYSTQAKAMDSAQTLTRQTEREQTEAAQARAQGAAGKLAGED